MSASAHEGFDGALVRRPRLLEALQRGTGGPVTLVTGPAGSGKTVLVRSWVRAGVFAQSGAWITVERGELDGLRFWGSVLEELRASGVATKAPGLQTLAVAPRGPVDELVRRLAERIDRLTDPALLVLDDVQHLEAQDALEALAWMLARAPPALRVILIGRREPQVGAHRLRVAGALTEIGEPELRFTREEARELFARASVSLSDESLDRLHARTEGWAAGLRLAAIGLTGLDDTRRFVSEFSGSERTVADYLMAEVLAAQPPEVRQLLLRTCVLERVNARWRICSRACGTGSACCKSWRRRVPWSTPWTRIARGFATTPSCRTSCVWSSGVRRRRKSRRYNARLLAGTPDTGSP